MKRARDRVVTTFTSPNPTDGLSIGKAVHILGGQLLHCYFARVTRFLLAFSRGVTGNKALYAYGGHPNESRRQVTQVSPTV
jgi:hypothetical protein